MAASGDYSAYTENPDQIISTVEELRKRGFIIEMDDCGSGYSSLNMLSQMTLDILKLDMKFIQNEMEKPMDQSLLNDVISMAHRMHLNVVAEGVETRDQKKRLQAMGCDFAQGYFFARPMPEADFEELLKTQCVRKIDSLHTSEHSGRSLLIIDEDSSYRERVRTYLENHYQILEASDDQEAFDCICRCGCQGISAILLDMALPKDGAAVFMKKMRQNPMFWKIPVIASVSCIQNRENEALMLETDDLICKNFPMPELHRHIERLRDIVAFRKRENILMDKANQDYLPVCSIEEGFRRRWIRFVRTNFLWQSACLTWII